MTTNIIKMITGEEVVAKEVAGNEDTFVFSKPRVLHLQQGPDGRVGAALAPWIFANPDCDVTLKESHILTIVKAPKELEDAYLQQTSGIQIASSL